MILSTTEVKSFLGITSTTYDNQISALLPICVDEFFNFTNNWFHNNRVKINSWNISATSSNQVIGISGTNFSTYHFASGDVIHIEESARNDGFYNVQTVASTIMTLLQSSDGAATYTLAGELEGESQWIVTKIDIPVGVKFIISQMIKYKIDYPTGVPLSESLGDYSVSYGNGFTGYSPGIQQAMMKYAVILYA